MKSEQQIVTVFVPSDDRNPSPCSRCIGSLLTIAILVGAGYCFYEYGIPQIEAAINNHRSDFNQISEDFNNAVREVAKAFEPTVKAINAGTGPFIWPVENDGWTSIKLAVSGGVSFINLA